MTCDNCGEWFAAEMAFDHTFCNDCYFGWQEKETAKEDLSYERMSAENPDME